MVLMHFFKWKIGKFVAYKLIVQKGPCKSASCQSLFDTVD